MTNAEAGGEIVTGPHRPTVQGFDSSKAKRISPKDLRPFSTQVRRPSWI